MRNKSLTIRKNNEKYKPVICLHSRARQICSRKYFQTLISSVLATCMISTLVSATSGSGHQHQKALSGAIMELKVLHEKMKQKNRMREDLSQQLPWVPHSTPLTIMSLCSALTASMFWLSSTQHSSHHLRV